MAEIKLKHGFALALLVYLGACHAYDNNYKFADGLLPGTSGQPLQTELDPPTGKQACCRGPYCWEFTPLFNYEITGLVFGVSHKFASKFGDVIAADVGLLWGENAEKKLYKDVKLRVMVDHYYARWGSGASFNLHDAANTHTAACDPAAMKKIKTLKTGDQARLRGWLVNARITKEPGETDPAKIMTWNSSVIRQDSGEGACELLYVASAGDVQVLSEGPRLWLWLKWLGLAGMAVSGALWAAAFHRQARREIAEAAKADF